MLETRAERAARRAKQNSDGSQPRKRRRAQRAAQAAQAADPTETRAARAAARAARGRARAALADDMGHSPVEAARGGASTHAAGGSAGRGAAAELRRRARARVPPQGDARGRWAARLRSRSPSTARHSSAGRRALQHLGCWRQLRPQRARPQQRPQRARPQQRPQRARAARQHGSSHSIRCTCYTPFPTNSSSCGS